jgi:hypothetical protein
VAFHLRAACGRGCRADLDGCRRRLRLRADWSDLLRCFGP